MNASRSQNSTRKIDLKVSEVVVATGVSLSRVAAILSLTRQYVTTRKDDGDFFSIERLVRLYATLVTSDTEGEDIVAEELERLCRKRAPWLELGPMADAIKNQLVPSVMVCIGNEPYELNGNSQYQHALLMSQSATLLVYVCGPEGVIKQRRLTDMFRASIGSDPTKYKAAICFLEFNAADIFPRITLSMINREWHGSIIDTVDHPTALRGSYIATVVGLFRCCNIDLDNADRGDFMAGSSYVYRDYKFTVCDRILSSQY